MAFVHVINVYAVTQGVEHAHAAHAQDDFLLQTVVGVASVEVIGQTAIPGRVLRQVGVQQIDRNDVTGASRHVIAPCANGHGAVFHRYSDARRLFSAKVFYDPGLDVFGLLALRVQMLAKISLAVQQRERRPSTLACPV